MIYSTEPTSKNWRTGRLKTKSVNDYAQGIRGVSPEEEKVGYDGKDLQKRKFLAWSERVKG